MRGEGVPCPKYATPRMAPALPRLGRGQLRLIVDADHQRTNTMLIQRHSEPHIVELEDGSAWRIWLGDLASTLKWMPTTQLSVIEIQDEFCTHALVDQEEGTRVRVIAAADHWPPEAVAERIEEAAKAGVRNV